MKIQWYRSATVGIFSKSGTAILCDPWITDGAFIGSWFHWPPLEGFEFDELASRKWDALYISHFHADHFDRKLVAKIARNQPSTIVLIPLYENKWLKRAVENCGFKSDRIQEIPSDQKIHFKDIDITMYVADYCNPEICGASIPCTFSTKKFRANDSVALFESDGKRVLNANDALAVHTAQRLWSRIGEIDLLLGHFGGAGPYPQCFNSLSDENKKQEALKTGWVFANRLISTSTALKARFVFPYAGQYLLGGRLSKLNDFRSVIPLPEVLASIRANSPTVPISLNAFGEFDLETESSTGDWIEPSNLDKENYITKISKNLYPYELGEPDFINGQIILSKALESIKPVFQQYLADGSLGSESSIVFQAEGIKSAINFGKNFCSVTDSEIFSKVTTISTDLRLLKRLILRKPNYQGFTQYHFNQAEIGSHFAWSRIGEYPKETRFLNYMQSTI
jgi:UDP-MurNAc hydroxylase